MRNLIIVSFIAVAAGAFAQNFEREAFLDAESRFLARNYSLALERYDEFLRAWPDSAYVADARFRRAVTLYYLGRTDEAYRGLSLVEARYRSTKYLDYIPYWKAVIEYDRGELEVAVERFTVLVKDPPDAITLSQALLYLGKASTALGRLETAITAFKHLINELQGRGELDPSALLFLADLYSKTDAALEAVEFWETINATKSIIDKLTNETRESLALRAAEAYAALGRDQAAIDLLDPLTVSPRREIAIAALQTSLVLAGKRGDHVLSAAMVVKAENALRSEPDQLAEFWLRVGAGAFHDGRLDLARSYFQRVMVLLPGETIHPDVPIYLAEISDREGRTAEAYNILSLAIPYAGEREALMRTRQAWYALKLERWDEAAVAAAVAFSAALQSAEPALAKLAANYRAYALYRTGAAPAALAALDEAFSAFEPDERAVATLKARLLRAVDQAPDSLALYDSLIAVASDDDPVLAELKAARIALLFEKAQYERVVAAAADYEITVAKVPAATTATSLVYYFGGMSATAIGSFELALKWFDQLSEESPASLGSATAWAVYYRAYVLYRLARFPEATQAFEAFLADYAEHERAYTAAYLGAWSAANSGSYPKAIAVASRALALAQAGQGFAVAADQGELIARAGFLLGTLKPFTQDWDGALAALQLAAATKSSVNPDSGTSYTVRAFFEQAIVLALAGRVEAADAAFAVVEQNFPKDPLAAEAAYQRGELFYRSKRYQVAADRFAAYRQNYREGPRADAALYFGGLALKAIGRVDQGILLWERLLTDFSQSGYRFAVYFAVAQAHREKRDWVAAFRAYTSALAEFGEAARQAGAAEEAEILRYLITGLPEKAARLHTQLTRENGAITEAGRAVALELAAFYINESSQREAGLPLLEDVIAMRELDPPRAAEAAMLKADYFNLVSAWDRASLAYLDAYAYASAVSVAAQTTDGRSLSQELAPEALYKAAQARKRSGKTEGLNDIIALLTSRFPSSNWTSLARRLVEATR